MACGSTSKKTMSDALHGVVVCHGDLAAALVSAVERISGVSDALTPVSNTDCDRLRLEDRITGAVADRPAIVFVDLPMGSCLMAAVRRVRSLPDVRLVTGVNLAMLVDFVFHREASPAEAADRAASTGTTAIRTPS